MKRTDVNKLALSLALAAAGAIASGGPAGAAAAPAPCGNAGSMMAGAAPKMPPATGNLDRDFAAAMVAQTHAMRALAKIELECGKNAKAKAAAQSFLDDEAQYMKTMELILHTN